jgi:lipoprotein-anchoring transpeptidase ErfK/SrfK
MTTISSGKKGKETQLGFWKVLSKRKDYRSRKYDNAPMPFAQMIDDKGVALHGGSLPGYPASRGCVRLPMKFAEKLFGLTRLGTKVVIEG